MASMAQQPGQTRQIPTSPANGRSVLPNCPARSSEFLPLPGTAPSFFQPRPALPAEVPGGSGGTIAFAELSIQTSSLSRIVASTVRGDSLGCGRVANQGRRLTPDKWRYRACGFDRNSLVRLRRYSGVRRDGVQRLTSNPGVLQTCCAFEEPSY